MLHKILEWKSGWANIFHFTAEDKYCCEKGQRVPGFWTNEAKFLFTCFEVDDNGNYCDTNYDFELEQWYRVEFLQFFDKSDNQVNYL